jgi:UDP-glucose 4-epimerase
MAKVGVTGATGFIGGALVPRLAADRHELVLIDDLSGPIRVRHDRWPADRSDFADASTLSRLEECDVVLHLAAVSGVVACADDPTGSARVNVAGTERLAAWCRSEGIPLAFASSFAVVGIPERLPITEETPARPTHEYARQKAAGEELIRGASGRDGVPTAVLRMSNVYGVYRAGDQLVAKGNVINAFAGQARTGVLLVNAPGTQRRDFIHLDDVLDHWAAAANWLADTRRRPDSVTVNVASGETATMLEISMRVARAWRATHPVAPDLQVRIVPNPRGSIELLQPEFAVDRSATERLLGVRCRRNLDEAIPDVLRTLGSSGGAPG